MGATLSALSKIKKIQKTKSPPKNKKTPLKKLLPAGDPTLTA